MTSFPFANVCYSVADALKRCSWWTQTTRKTAAEEEAEEEADEGLLASSTMTFALSG